uniref:Uncharacterized protein n=1 Tax=Glossina pallidipes TaxID=7398 RepID=A0A1A9ZZY2_GLOPL
MVPMKNTNEIIGSFYAHRMTLLLLTGIVYVALTKALPEHSLWLQKCCELTLRLKPCKQYDGRDTPDGQQRHYGDGERLLVHGVLKLHYYDKHNHDDDVKLLAPLYDAQRRDVTNRHDAIQYDANRRHDDVHQHDDFDEQHDDRPRDLCNAKNENLFVRIEYNAVKIEPINNLNCNIKQFYAVGVVLVSNAQWHKSRNQS